VSHAASELFTGLRDVAAEPDFEQAATAQRFEVTPSWLAATRVLRRYRNGLGYHVGMAKRSRTERPHESLDPVLDFMRLLWSVEHGLQSTSKRMGATLGITGPQRLVLKIVSQFPDLSAGELAHVLHLHPSTITGVIQRLVDKRLLVRQADPQDTRRVRLRVAPRARSFTRQTRGTVEAAVEVALRRVPADRIRHAREVLTAVAKALDGAAS